MIEAIDADQIRAALSWPVIIAALRVGFADGADITVPQRHHHTMGDAETSAGDADAPTMLLMPAWSSTYAGVKVVNVFPTNRGTGVATINGSYLLTSGSTGEPLAILDGAELTARRTAAASVLAATYLARPESSRLVVVGSGRVAHDLAEAYSAMFPIEQITVWNHRPFGAERLAAELSAAGLPAAADTDLEAACASADIVTCATLSSEPLVNGAWLQPGTHVDLVGGFTPAMREADDEAVRRSRVFVDTMAGALAEAGDITQPLERGVLTREQIGGDLFGLTSGTVVVDRDNDDITLFKSVGHALEDLVAGAAVYEARTAT